MTTDPPPPPPPDGPRRATLRARSRTNPVRPEVIDALDELERSLGDVARWEQLLTGKEVAPEWQHPAGEREARPRHLGPEHLAATPETPAVPATPWMADDDLDAVVADLHEAIQSLDDRIEEIRPDTVPITFEPGDDAPDILAAGYALGQVPFDDPGADDEVVPIEASPLLLQARTIGGEAPARSASFEAAAEQLEIEKRRRNGRLLTWTGLALLVGLGALFLLPSDGDGDGDVPPDTRPPDTVEVPTSELLPEFTFDPGALTTTLPTAPAPDPATPTTARSTTRTTARPTTPRPTTPVTQAPVVTQPPPPSSLPQPGPVPPPTTTPTTDPTTSTTLGGGVTPP